MSEGAGVAGAAPEPILVGGAVEAGGGEPLPSFDPSSGAQIALVGSADLDDVGRAVAAARAAFEGEWGCATPAERGRLLSAVAARIRERQDELAELDVRDAGLPLRMAKGDVANAARYFEYYAGVADKAQGDSIPLGKGFVDFTLREPHGVCAVVAPFNVPLQLFARSVAPALAMGNSVVVKVAEQAPLPGLALGSLVAELAPRGALSALAGLGAEVGSCLVGHKGVDQVTFTGSLETGRQVMRAAAQWMTPVTLELGGKSPQIVFADADLEIALDAIVASAFLTAGQVCSAGTRILVEETAFDRVREALVERARAIVVGPAVDDPEMGPLVSAAQRDRVLAAVADAAASGASVLAGGGVPAELEGSGGYFVSPTVVGDVDPGAVIAREEVFGPVIVVLPFGSAEEALRMVNDSEYGLVAGVWTRDVGRAMALAEGIRAGQVFVNNFGVGGGVELPFGGYGLSGIGREKGLAALLEYTQVKNVCVRADLR